MATFDDVQQLISEKLSVDAADVKPESSFIDDLGADSLDLADLVMAIEEQYQIDFANEDTEQFKTVSDVVNAIDRLKS
ncbi:acyl carrier protein [bacterium]|nr:acyl carrier protein [bacterium]MCB1216534.1 acyl carrier protein [bacterium]MCB1219830.1 acyl carrier protein [bacterium]UNM07137.1 MAG: acyl carrier protein [Planctomycetales bacterium]